MKRIFLIVLDSFGIGAMPDAGRFGDGDVNTLRSCAATGKLHIPNLIAAGLGNIQKLKDGDPLGGRTSAADEFQSVEDEDFLS